ncbi:MAG: hypothetical protein II127_08535, partial [Ruminococcus sp.]|nr:hypothetical protein [Ruminococcus sp.]
MENSEKTPSTLVGRRWYPIDNASNLYAAARRKRWCRTFRISAILKEDVDPAVLQTALTDVTP